MKKLIPIIIVSLLPFIGCAGTSLKTVATDAGTVVLDVSQLLTAANAIWTQVGKTLSASQFEALLASYGVNSSQYTAIESIIGLGSTTGAVSVTVTSTLASVIDAYAASLK